MKGRTKAKSGQKRKAEDTLETEGPAKRKCTQKPVDYAEQPERESKKTLNDDKDENPILSPAQRKARRIASHNESEHRRRKKIEFNKACLAYLGYNIPATVIKDHPEAFQALLKKYGEGLGSTCFKKVKNKTHGNLDLAQIAVEKDLKAMGITLNKNSEKAEAKSQSQSSNNAKSASSRAEAQSSPVVNPQLPLASDMKPAANAETTNPFLNNDQALCERAQKMLLDGSVELRLKLNALSYLWNMQVMHGLTPWTSIPAEILSLFNLPASLSLQPPQTHPAPQEQLPFSLGAMGASNSNSGSTTGRLLNQFASQSSSSATLTPLAGLDEPLQPAPLLRTDSPPLFSDNEVPSLAGLNFLSPGFTSPSVSQTLGEPTLSLPNLGLDLYGEQFTLR